VDWEYAEWRRARVSLDYHVEIGGFYYSVPHALLRAEVDIRITAHTVEIFHRGQRVGAHMRRYGGPRHGTDPDRMPSSHRRYAEWSPERFRRWARSIGPETEGLVIAVLANRPHPEQGFSPDVSRGMTEGGRERLVLRRSPHAGMRHRYRALRFR
jgi:hypothetical protein